MATDCNGNTYIADYDNGVVRKVDAFGVITTFAGNGSIGYSGDGGPATSAQLSNPNGLAIDGLGNVYIADYNNMVIRKVDVSGTITTFAGNGGHGYSGDGGPATSAMLFYPVGLAVDNANNVYIADYLNSAIRMVNTSGIISTVAGNGTAGYSGDGGSGNRAELAYPRSVAVDNWGNIYIADYDNEVIRKVNTYGTISTIAGIGIAGYSGDGNDATLAQLNDPWGIAVDGYGDVYFSELHNNIIRKIDTLGIISTIAGNYSEGAGYSGDNNFAIKARLYQPMGIAINCSGNLYVADNASYVVRILGKYNRAPSFTGGATQTLSVCQNNPITSLNALLTVNDYDTAQAMAWTIASDAAHGTLAITYTTNTTGGVLAPSGLTYTPAPGFIGADQFTILVSDGKATAATTINVNVSDLFYPDYVSGATELEPGTEAVLFDMTPGGNWSSTDETVATVNDKGKVTGVADGTTVISYSITNSCGVAASTIAITVDESAGRKANTTGVAATTTTVASLQIFPNPTKGTFNVKTSGDGTFYLISMEGRAEAKYAVSGQQAVINVPAGLPDGIYVGRFIGTDGSTTDVKLVYQQ